MTSDEAIQHLQLLAQACDAAPLNGPSHRNVRASIEALRDHLLPPAASTGAEAAAKA